MRWREIVEGVGRIVKGVNTTADVGEDEIIIQAAKFGFKVDRNGVPAAKLFESELEGYELYHGTPFEHLVGIFMVGRIIHRPGIDQGHHGVSFTTDIEVAKGFANEDAHDSSTLYGEVLGEDENRCRSGCIITCEPARLGKLDRYEHGGDDLEAEWRTHGDVPLSAISSIALVRSEVEAYREDYLRAGKTFDASASHMPDDWKEGMAEWLHNPKRLAAIDAILANPLLRKWPI
jgi:hypothetical protein